MQHNVLCVDFVIPTVCNTSFLLTQWSSQKFRGFKLSCEWFWFSTKKVFFWGVEANANISCQVSPRLSASTFEVW